MTEHDVRRLARCERRQACDLFYRSVHRDPLGDEKWDVVSGVDDRAFGAFVEGVLVGTTMSLASGIVVPGGRIVPAAAVTRVGVRADSTRRGALTALMRAQLNAARAEGEPIVMLHASEARIYGRYGFGVASRGRNLRLSRGRAVPRDTAPKNGEVRLVDVDEAARILPGIYRRIGTGRPGMIERPDDWWRVSVALGQFSVVAVHTRDDGVDDAFALYDVRVNDHRFGDGKGTLRLNDLHAADANAAASTWRFLLGVDLVDEIQAFARPLDEPVEWWLADRRACEVTRVDDDLWLRLVDVPSALNARSFGAAEPVVLAVEDEFLPENAGNYRIGPDGAQRCAESAQLVVDAATLAALYLGDVTVSTLVSAGLVEVRDPSSVTAADELFRSTTVAWCGTPF